MGKCLHQYILEYNTDSFQGFCRNCLKLNFLYSSITMQNDHCSHQYTSNKFFLDIICMSTMISPSQHCLIVSTLQEKCGISSTTERIWHSISSQRAYKMYDGRANNSMCWNTFMLHQQKKSSDMNMGVHKISAYHNCTSNVTNVIAHHILCLFRVVIHGCIMAPPKQFCIIFWVHYCPCQINFCSYYCPVLSINNASIVSEWPCHILCIMKECRLVEFYTVRQQSVRKRQKKYTMIQYHLLTKTD
jgi:hypothetical protein